MTIHTIAFNGIPELITVCDKSATDTLASLGVKKEMIEELRRKGSVQQELRTITWETRDE